MRRVPNSPARVEPQPRQWSASPSGESGPAVDLHPRFPPAISVKGLAAWEEGDARLSEEHCDMHALREQHGVTKPAYVMERMRHELHARRTDNIQSHRLCWLVRAMQKDIPELQGPIGLDGNEHTWAGGWGRGDGETGVCRW